MEEEVILTGGSMYPWLVTVYNTNGWVKTLPHLGQPRYGHGCGHYISNFKLVISVDFENVDDTFPRFIL